MVHINSKTSFSQVNWERHFKTIRDASFPDKGQTDDEIGNKTGMHKQTCRSAITQMIKQGLLFENYKKKFDPNTGRHVRTTQLNPGEVYPEEEQLELY